MKGVLALNPQEVLSVLPETIVQVDTESRLVAVNRPDSGVFQRTAVRGDSLEELFGSDEARMIVGLIHSAQRAGVTDGEYHKGTRIFAVTVDLLRSSGLTLLVFRDVTVRRHTEQTLIELIRDRSGVLASVSHDLRTPLIAVMGYADLLSQPSSHLDDTARMAMVRDMTDQAWDLAGIVEDLLTVAQIEIGDLWVAGVPVNLTANTAQVIESMGERGRRIMVTGDKTTTALGDPARFRQIVRNLLSNALTHGSEPIAVDVSADGTNALLTVKDRGGGVPEHLKEEIFSRATTANGTRSPNRVGIGLWIARELAGLMGGEVEYKREHGLTQFRVTMPLAQP